MILSNRSDAVSLAAETAFPLFRLFGWYYLNPVEKSEIDSALALERVIVRLLNECEEGESVESGRFMVRNLDGEVQVFLSLSSYLEYEDE